MCSTGLVIAWSEGGAGARQVGVERAYKGEPLNPKMDVKTMTMKANCVQVTVIPNKYIQREVTIGSLA